MVKYQKNQSYPKNPKNKNQTNPNHKNKNKHHSKKQTNSIPNSNHQNNNSQSIQQHLLTQPIFNIIPSGEYQDKFAALNSDYQSNHSNQHIQNQHENQYIQQQHYQQQQEQQQDLIYQQEQSPQNQPQQNQINNQQQPKNNAIKQEIDKIIQILTNLPKLSQGKSKQFYLQKLISHTHLYYGYNHQLINHFLNFLTPNQMIQFLQANTIQTPLTIRTNTLKIKRKQLSQLLIQRGINLDLLAQWSKVGIKIYDTKVPIGTTPQYLAGYYTLQSGSSLLSVLALDPQENQKILDLTSAPGTKTSYISQIMKNTGSIVANDLDQNRLKALRYNLNRLGISNTLVTCRDARKYSQIFPNTFDRVILDPPCSNLGIISKKPTIKTNLNLENITKFSNFQKQLLLSAIDCTKIGGIIIYTTTSISPLENQQVINYALKKKFIKIVQIDNLTKIGENGITKFEQNKFHSDLKKTKRIYPHQHNLNGSYIAKLIKISQGNKQTISNQTKKQQI